MQTTAPIFADKCILILEDNALIACQISDLIEEAGAIPSIASNSDEAFVILHSASAPDAALLDLRLNGLSVSVAEHLDAAGVPFAFVTGNPDDVPAHLRCYPVCAKPFTPGTLLRALTAACLQTGE